MSAVMDPEHGEPLPHRMDPSEVGHPPNMKMSLKKCIEKATIDWDAYQMYIPQIMYALPPDRPAVYSEAVSAINGLLSAKNTRCLSKLIALEILGTIVTTNPDVALKAVIKTKTHKRLVEFSKGKKTWFFRKKTNFGADADTQLINEIIQLAANLVQHWIHISLDGSVRDTMKATREEMRKQGVPDYPIEQRTTSEPPQDMSRAMTQAEGLMSAPESQPPPEVAFNSGQYKLSLDAFKDILSQVQGSDQPVSQNDILEAMSVELHSASEKLQSEAQVAVDSGNIDQFCEMSRMIDEITWALDAYNEAVLVSSPEVISSTLMPTSNEISADRKIDESKSAGVDDERTTSVRGSSSSSSSSISDDSKSQAKSANILSKMSSKGSRLSVIPPESPPIPSDLSPSNMDPSPYSTDGVTSEAALPSPETAGMDNIHSYTSNVYENGVEESLPPLRPSSFSNSPASKSSMTINGNQSFGMDDRDMNGTKAIGHSRKLFDDADKSFESRASAQHTGHEHDSRYKDGTDLGSLLQSLEKTLAQDVESKNKKEVSERRNRESLSETVLREVKEKGRVQSRRTPDVHASGDTSFEDIVSIDTDTMFQNYYNKVTLTNKMKDVKKDDPRSPLNVHYIKRQHRDKFAANLSRISRTHSVKSSNVSDNSYASPPSRLQHRYQTSPMNYSGSGKVLMHKKKEYLCGYESPNTAVRRRTNERSPDNRSQTVDFSESPIINALKTGFQSIQQSAHLCGIVDGSGQRISRENLSRNSVAAKASQMSLQAANVNLSKINVGNRSIKSTFQKSDNGSPYVHKSKEGISKPQKVDSHIRDTSFSKVRENSSNNIRDTSLNDVCDTPQNRDVSSPSHLSTQQSIKSSASINELDRDNDSLKNELMSLEAQLRPKVESQIRSQIIAEKQNVESANIEKRDREILKLKRKMDRIMQKLEIVTHKAIEAEKQNEKYKINLKSRNTVASHAKEMWLQESEKSAELKRKLGEARQMMAHKEDALKSLQAKIQPKEMQVSQPESPIKKNKTRNVEETNSLPTPMKKRVIDADKEMQQSNSFDNYNQNEISAKTSNATSQNFPSVDDRDGRRHNLKIEDINVDEEIRKTRVRPFDSYGPSRVNHGRLDGGAFLPRQPAREFPSTLKEPSLEDFFDQHGGLNLDFHDPYSFASLNYSIETSQTQREQFSRFRGLLQSDDAILFENNSIQIGFVASFQSEGDSMVSLVDLYFGNLSKVSFDFFTAECYVDVAVNQRKAISGQYGDRPSLPLADGSEYVLEVLDYTIMDNQIHPLEQKLQTWKLRSFDPFDSWPILRVRYMMGDATPTEIRVALPITVSKFCIGTYLSTEDYAVLWQSETFMFREVTRIVHLHEQYRNSQIVVTQGIAMGSSLHRIQGLDSNPNILSFCGRFFRSNPNIDMDSNIVLVRCELGTNQRKGKVRIAVRSDHSVLASAFCRLLRIMLSSDSLITDSLCVIS